MVADSIGSEAKRLPSPPLCRLSPKPIYSRLKPRWWIVVADTTRVKKQDKGVRNYISSGGAGKRGQSRKKQRWRTVVTGSGGSQWRRRGYHSFLLLHTPVVGTKHLRLDQEKQQQKNRTALKQRWRTAAVAGGRRHGLHRDGEQRVKTLKQRWRIPSADRGGR